METKYFDNTVKSKTISGLETMIALVHFTKNVQEL